MVISVQISVKLLAFTVEAIIDECVLFYKQLLLRSGHPISYCGLVSLVIGQNDSPIRLLFIFRRYSSHQGCCYLRSTKCQIASLIQYFCFFMVDVKPIFCILITSHITVSSDGKRRTRFSSLTAL